MDFVTQVGLVGVGAIVLLLIGIVFMIVSCLKKVDQGTALIINKYKGDPIVKFTGGIVIPVIHKAEYMDISLKTIEIDRHGEDGLICADNIRADIKVVFFVRVNKTESDVMKVAQSIGCQRASTQETLESLFMAKFSEALKTVGKKTDFVDLYKERTKFKEEIIENIGEYLNGYRLEDVAIDYLEQTPLENLDPDNILDSQGIKKIRELTAKEKINANQIRCEEEKTIKEQNVDAREKILELERRQEEAEAKQKREVLSFQAQEEAETEVIRAKEQEKADLARIAAEEEIAKALEEKERMIIVARKKKEMEEAVQQERLLKEQEKEKTERHKEIALLEIDKERAVEEEQKKIQEVIRERVKVESTVAEEEENIKKIRVVSEAERLSEVALIDAKREADENKIKEVKKAEARSESSSFEAQEKKILAEAEEEASVRIAEARKKEAEGLIAIEAANGLATAKVDERKAEVLERQGQAEAKKLEMVAIAEAKKIHLKGEAEAKAKELNYTAEATGIAKSKEAEATGIEAVSKAEAVGITEKAEAMKIFDGVGRDHEEFKLKLSKEERIELAEINIQKDIAKDQAMLVSEGLKHARIDIVGGENDFFKKLVNSIGYGKAVNRFVENTDLKKVLSTEEGAQLVQTLKNLFKTLNLKTEDIKNITISALLGKLVGMAKEGNEKEQLQKLMGKARELGLGDTLAGWLIS